MQTVGDSGGAAGPWRGGVVQRINRARIEASHWLLLRLAGSAPDDLIAQCRLWLAEGRVLDVGRTVAHAVLGHRLRLTDEDVDLLAELLAVDGADASAL